MKRGTKALTVGIVVFLMINGFFYIYPPISFFLLKPFSSAFYFLVPWKMYSGWIGHEYKEFVNLSILESIFIGIISYFIIPGKDEK